MALKNLGTINDNGVRTQRHQTVKTSEPNDIFKFTITNERSVNLLLIDHTGDADLALYKDSNGNGTLQTFGQHRDKLISTSANGSFADDHINRWSQPGTYFAVVEQYSSTSPVRYDLYVAASRQSILTGPPNTLARENDLGTLSYDRTFNDESVGFRADSGTNGFSDNEVGDTSDLYYFNLPAGHSVDITLSGLNADADIRLIDDDGDRIIEPGEDVRRGTNAGTTNDVISWSTPGDYYLQVYPWAQNNNIEYDLRFDYT